MKMIAWNMVSTGFKSSLCLLATVALITTGSPKPARAGMLGGALLGGVGGSLVGGILGGRSGSRAGALIGGFVGAASGAERSYQRRYIAQRRAAAYAPSSYRAAPRRAAPVASASSTTVVETQKALVRLGFDPGPIDGAMGASTRRAIRTYQQAQGLPVTGQPSDALLKHMLRNGG